MSERAATAHNRWTMQQWEAITARGRNLLVAAAAGSGKTAVLVERIIRLISEGEEPLDVDRLLVATFTKAAADEMRDRIREALEKKLAERPDSEHLRRQLVYVHRASITTLHSFCLEVIRRHGQSIHLDADCRIASEEEIDLIRRDVLEDVFERYYAESAPDSAFWQLVDAYGSDRSDEPLFELVSKIYDFSRSHPWPEHWLASVARAFHVPEEGPADETSMPWLASLRRDVAAELSGVLGLLREAHGLSCMPGGPAPYADSLAAEARAVEAAAAAAQAGSWPELAAAVQAVGFGKLKPVRGNEADKRLKERVQELRKQAKERFEALREECFTRSPDDFAGELRRIAPQIDMLVRLVGDFADRFAEVKRSKGLLDFSDLEHLCLAILLAPESRPGRPVPSEAALEYREQFAEVLIDEYQDTNLVQETIIGLISRPGAGNRFMVGDVKQSIYRFRLADPGLFLRKYQTYDATLAGEGVGTSAVDDAAASPSEGFGASTGKGAEASPGESGRRIDLAHNFRSRPEVLNAVNFVFRQIMTETVGELAYDERAMLVHGFPYPEPLARGDDPFAVEVMLLDRSDDVHAPQADEETAEPPAAPASPRPEEAPGGAGAEESDAEPDDPETVRLEARAIAARIGELMGASGGSPLLVYDKKSSGVRPLRYGDIVILLRADKDWAPHIMEELRLAGIPASGESSAGYFDAVEVETVLSLLRVIDNPYQDIPLAAVLRSPMFRFSEEDLARIRLCLRGGPYYEAVRNAAAAADDESLRKRCADFLAQLELWRMEARHGSVADLIWRVYRMTGYFDMAGGMPNGAKRQANLRALYDRARQYERTSFRGLFRFLRFIERMRESGKDLGEAGAAGESEDVVRIMSIHKSKGLEFPVVFVAGLGKSFNMQDLNGAFLLHKELGFGPKLVEETLRISYPTLPHLAIRRRLRLEMLAEEMRILYVAMTRAREKLILIATSANLAKQAESWSQAASCREWELPDGMLARARSYLDWLGPALFRHPQAASIRAMAGWEHYDPPSFLAEDSSRWKTGALRRVEVAEAAAAREARDETIIRAMYRGEPVFHLHSRWTDLIEQRLEWEYSHRRSSEIVSKTSVSELKRRWEFLAAEEEESSASAPSALRLSKPLLQRPAFLEEREMTPAERGTLYHLAMQHLPVGLEGDPAVIAAELSRLAARGILPIDRLQALEPEVLARFFRTDLAKRMAASANVWREVPFSYGLPAETLDPGMSMPKTPEDGTEAAPGETVLVQGVIDCVFAEDDGLVLLDYKTDAVRSETALAGIRDRYALQIDVYARALAEIWRTPVKEAHLFLFDTGTSIRMK